MRKASAPFIHTQKNTPYIQLILDIALLPCCVSAVFNYGLKAAVNIVVAVFLSFVIDIFYEQKIHKSNNYYDLSSAFYGMCFALMLPPDTCVIVTVTGILLGNIIAKCIPGGVGNLFINPAVTGRVIVELLFPNALQGFVLPGEDWLSLKGLLIWDKVSAASETDLSGYYFLEIFAGRYPTFIGTGCIIFIILGFIYLAARKGARFYAAAGYAAVIVTGMMIMYFPMGLRYSLIRLIASGIPFAATFLMTDPTTIPSNSRGGVCTGVTAGITALLLMPFNNTLALICVPVLVSNFTTVTFEYFTLFRRNKESREAAL